MAAALQRKQKSAARKQGNIRGRSRNNGRRRHDGQRGQEGGITCTSLGVLNMKRTGRNSRKGRERNRQINHPVKEARDAGAKRSEQTI